MIPNLTRRRLILAAASSLTAGCSLSPTLDLVGRSFASRGEHPSRYPMSDDEIRSLRYATLGVKIGDGAAGVMVLARIEDGALHWVSRNGVELVTRRGRLVQTRGLPRDLVSTSWVSEDPLLAAIGDGAMPGENGAVSRFAEVGGRKKAERVGIASSFAPRAAEEITTLDGNRPVGKLAENAVMPEWRWKVQNLFWADQESGMILRSRQQYCPEIPPIELELLKAAKIA